MVRYLILILLAGFSQAKAGQAGMSSVPDRYAVETGAPIIVKNMPKLRFQRAIGLCTTVAAATLIDHANCVSAKTADCASVPDDKKVSALDISRFNRDPKDDQDSESLDSYPELKEGGKTAAVLNRAAVVVGASVQESCAPYDQFFAGVEDPDSMAKSVWKRFEPEYKKGKSKSGCPACLAAAASKLKNKYGFAASEEQIRAAFSADTYNKFLDGILIPKECKKPNTMIYVEGNYKIGYFPRTDDFGKSSDKEVLYSQEISVVKDLLSRQIPLSLDYCFDPAAKDLHSCKAAHAVVVKGYKKLCDPENNDCKDVLQIQNSLGQKWQDDFKDGWVDAKVLLDETRYEAASLSWLDPNRVTYVFDKNTGEMSVTPY